MNTVSRKYPFFAPLAFGVAAVLLTAPAQADDAAPGALSPQYLRCEYKVNPFGIDVTKPRLSWLLGSDQRDQKQTAYQVLVASDTASLQQNKADLWDSGKAACDDTTAIVYEGKPLVSHQRCFWKVKVWDKDGKPSAWSKPAAWSMGLLDPSEWKAQWIGYDKPRNETKQEEAALDDAKWIWHADDKEANKPKAHRLFLTTLTLPDDAKVEKADLLVTADDAYKFTINGTLVASSNPGNDSWKTVSSVNVAQHLKAGVNTVRAEVENATPSPAGLIAKLTVTTADGKNVTLVTDGSWKSLADPGANWHNREIALADLPAASIVGDLRCPALGQARQGRTGPAPAALSADLVPARQACPPRHAVRLGARDL